MNIRRCCFGVLLWSVLATTFQASALVNIFGDSILADNTPIQSDLETLAPTATFENYARIGAGMRDGWIESIPTIYSKNREPMPSVIILDGGGNDVNAVRQDCLAMTSVCKDTIDKVAAMTSNLLENMREDGVPYVMYVGFYYIQGFEKVVDYSYDRVAPRCLPADGCYLVDLRNVTIQVGWDGMHPVTASYHDIAQTIWTTKLRYDVPFA
jgi:hypothetical protein